MALNSVALSFVILDPVALGLMVLDTWLWVMWFWIPYGSGFCVYESCGSRSIDPVFHDSGCCRSGFHDSGLSAIGLYDF